MSKDDTYNKNFTRIPNIIFESPRYAHLTKEELFLYCRLRSVFWDTRPHFHSLRDLGEITRYSRGALGKMLPHLNGCGLIHAQIEYEMKDGVKKGNPKYRISIPDIWEENRKYFETCPPNEPSLVEVVQNLNEPVHEKSQTCPPNEPRSSTKRAKVGTFDGQVRAQVERAKDNKDITKDTLKIESVVSEVSAVEPLAPSVAPSSPSQSPSLFSEEEMKPKEKPPSKKKEKKAEPVMPLQDAPWPSRETAVQIVEAKKGRIYSDTTRKQELQEAGKILEMTVDNAPITREQFESAWDDLASSSWWDEHGKACMIKYLRRDDTIVGIVKKLKRRTKPSTNQQTQIVDIDAEREKMRQKSDRNLEILLERKRKRELAEQGAKNG